MTKAAPTAQGSNSDGNTPWRSRRAAHCDMARALLAGATTRTGYTPMARHRRGLRGLAMASVDSGGGARRSQRALGSGRSASPPIARTRRSACEARRNVRRAPRQGSRDISHLPAQVRRIPGRASRRPPRAAREGRRMRASRPRGLISLEAELSTFRGEFYADTLRWRARSRARIPARHPIPEARPTGQGLRATGCEC